MCDVMASAIWLKYKYTQTMYTFSTAALAIIINGMREMRTGNRFVESCKKRERDRVEGNEGERGWGDDEND